MLKTSRLEYGAYLFIIVHIFVWTLAPALTRYALPLDSIEGATWGKQLQWGYDKNPFLSGWLTALAIMLGHHADWVVYLFSQCAVACGLWATWKLGKKMLSPRDAFIAMMLLEGIQYFNIHAIDFSDNTLEIGLWGLIVLSFYSAVCQQRWRNWILTGILSGLGLMAKYYTLLLLIAMFIFVLTQQTARKSLKNPGFYAGFIMVVLIITPHILWLFSHHFVTVTYALGRITDPPAWLNHLFFPYQFAWQQFTTFIPPCLFMLIFIVGRKLKPDSTITPFNQQFLWIIGVGPFLLTLLLSICFGIKLRAGWGQPLLSLWSLLLVAQLRPALTGTRLYVYSSVYSISYIMLIAIYCLSLIAAQEPSSANFPSKTIATLLTDEWNKRYHTKLCYLAGSRWAAGSVAYYSQDHPSVYIDWNPKMSAWINEDSLKKTGAIFVVGKLWGDTKIAMSDIKKRFPTMGPVQILHFHWLRNQKMALIDIQVAFLAPAQPTI